MPSSSSYFLYHLGRAYRRIDGCSAGPSPALQAPLRSSVQGWVDHSRPCTPELDFVVSADGGLDAHRFPQPSALPSETQTAEMHHESHIAIFTHALYKSHTCYILHSHSRQSKTRAALRATSTWANSGTSPGMCRICFNGKNRDFIETGHSEDKIWEMAFKMDKTTKQ